MKPTVNDTLDDMTDAAVPACLDAIRALGIDVTIEDGEALSDWLQDRFRIRVEDILSA